MPLQISLGGYFRQKYIQTFREGSFRLAQEEALLPATKTFSRSIDGDAAARIDQVPAQESVPLQDPLGVELGHEGIAMAITDDIDISSVIDGDCSARVTTYPLQECVPFQTRCGHIRTFPGTEILGASAL